jgi:MFS family permease
MTAGRFAGDRFVHRFGAARLTRACGVISTLGLVVALATRSPTVTIAGFTLLGAGLAIEVPQVFAAGGRADPDRPGSGLAKVVGMGYAGQTAGPAIIGALATAIGLRLAFSITIVLAALIAIAAPALTWQGTRRVRQQEPAASTAAEETPHPADEEDTQREATLRCAYRLGSGLRSSLVVIR